jgi:hypothetical protein
VNSKSINPGTPHPMPPATPVAIMSAILRGGYHKTHKVYLGGGIIGNDWLLTGKYRYSTQRRDEKYIEKIEKRLIERRDATDDKKFNGTLNNGSGKKLDKDQFVRALKQKVREHGHETFFAIGKTVGGTCIVHDLITDYHMFTVSDAITSFVERSDDTRVTKDVYEEIKMDYFELS